MNAASKPTHAESAAFRFNQTEFPVYSNYNALELGHMPLLTILSDPDDSGKIRGRLSHCDPYAEPPPVYHASSYYWSAPGVEKLVYVHGEEVRLRETLWSFLRILCNSKTHFVRVAEITVWLDVLCIYPDRSCIKHRGNLRFVPQFCEGVDFRSGT